MIPAPPPRGSRAVLTLALFAALLALFVARPTAARAGEGTLVARTPDGQERGPFPLTRTEVSAEVTGRVVSVDVTQRFDNPFRDRIEAVYTFPLPEDSAVDAMEMHIGPRVVRAVVQQRAQARQTYEQAAAQGRRAALVEQERPNVFTVAVANIDPGTAIEVRLHYFALARYDHGTYELVYPMTVGPRYIPGAPVGAPQSGTGTQGDTDRVPDASRITPPYAAAGARSGHSIGLRVALEAGTPIATIETPAHAVDVQRPAPTRARISLRDRNEIPNRDFILRWTLLAPEVEAAVFATRPDPAAPGYVALMLEPKHDVPAGEIAARELFFLLDTSGSMQGPPLETAKNAVRRALGSLHPSDTFQIVDFADTASTFAPRPLPNTPENVARANRYLDSLAAAGGTNQLLGIHAALSAPGDAMRLRHVVFMTDGYIGNEAEVIGLVRREIGNARIFGFGIGSSVNRFLLEEVSRAGRGNAEYLRPNEQPNALIERFYQRIGRPYLTDIQVDWGALPVDQMLPTPVPDLSAFEPLVLLARYRGPAQGTVRVRGRIAGRPWEREYNVSLPAAAREHAAISRIWARERIADLIRATHFQGEQPQLVGDITGIALAHNLVSPYTSLVAVDLNGAPAPAPSGGPRTVVQPNEAPQGVNVGAAGGTVITAPPIAPPIYAEGRFQARYRVAETSGVSAGSGSDGDYERRGASPSAPESEALTVSTRGRRGCASCAVGAGQGDPNEMALAAFITALALLALRHRRRRQS